MIAIGGDSGTGKRTLCDGFELIFGRERIASVSLDDYHSLDRAQRKAVGFSALDPRASNFAAMEEDLWALREGRGIDKAVYDPAGGTFVGQEHLEPKEFILVAGFFPLYTRALRSLFDVTVWLDPERELKAAWKMQRDTLRRGYTEDDVRNEIDESYYALGTHVQPQARYADLKVTFFRPAHRPAPADAATLSARIRKGGRLRPLEYSEFESPATSLRQLKNPAGGYPETVIEIDGAAPADVAGAVEQHVWSHLDARSRERPAGLGTFTDARGKPERSFSLALVALLIARRMVMIESELLETA
jgi:phosphoribulokinase